jgi:ComF family protein
MALALTASIKAISNTLLDLFYPPRCGGCNEAGAGWWCPRCDAQVYRFAGSHALHNIALPNGATLVVISAGLFASPLREGIHRFKYEGQPQLAEAFGTLMCEAWRANALTADAIVPVPLHPSRRRERGFNQSELLAGVISRHTHVPMMHGLRRKRRTEQQAHLGAAARVANVKDAFVADGGAAAKHIVLVDDVLTTGATLAECAMALSQAGAASVLSITLARAQT